MDDDDCRRFFLEPDEVLHRRYEILRAFFVDRQSLHELAHRFGFTYHAIRSVVRDFRAQGRAGQLPPFSPRRPWGDRHATRPLRRRWFRRNPSSPTCVSWTLSRDDPGGPESPAFSSSCPC